MDRVLGKFTVGRRRGNPSATASRPGDAEALAVLAPPGSVVPAVQSVVWSRHLSRLATVRLGGERSSCEVHEVQVILAFASRPRVHVVACAANGFGNTASGRPDLPPLLPPRPA